MGESAPPFLINNFLTRQARHQNGRKIGPRWSLELSSGRVAIFFFGFRQFSNAEGPVRSVFPFQPALPGKFLTRQATCSFSGVARLGGAEAGDAESCALVRLLQFLGPLSLAVRLPLIGTVF